MRRNKGPGSGSALRSSTWRGGSWSLLRGIGAAALVGLCAMLGVSVAHATITQALSLAELVQGADHVALVTCVDARASRDGSRRIVTDYTLRVEETMAGPSSAGDTLTMRGLGGEIGDLGMRVEGEPRMNPGDRYVVFLRRLSDGRTLRPVGMSQGVLPVDEDRGALRVHPGADGLALVHRVRGGQLAPAPGALLHATPFVDLRRRVEALAPGSVRP